MNARERGFLLLTSHLGDPERRVLTTAQLRTLAMNIGSERVAREDRELSVKDLISVGYSGEAAEHIVALLRQERELDAYLARGAAMGCTPVTRVSDGYPSLLRQRLGLSPA